MISVWLSVTVRLQFEDNISRKLEGLRTLHQTTSFAHSAHHSAPAALHTVHHSAHHSAQPSTPAPWSPFALTLVCTELHCMEVNLSELAAASGMDESIGLWCW